MLRTRLCHYFLLFGTLAVFVEDPSWRLWCVDQPVNEQTHLTLLACQSPSGSNVRISIAFWLRIGSMLWFALALIAPLLFASTNFIEKYLLSRIAEGDSAGPVTILTGLCVTPLLIVFGWFARHQLAHYSLRNALGGILVGLLTTAAFYVYYRALKVAETSVVATLFQMIIVANYVLGLIFLHESLSLLELAGIGLILLGSISINLDKTSGKTTFNRRVFWLMAVASLAIAFSNIVFKFVAVESSYVPTQFYEFSAGLIASITVFCLSRSARRGFLDLLSKHKVVALSLGEANELLNLSGLAAMRYAMLLVPVAIVQAVMSVQAIYLIGFGAILTIFFPHIIKENISRQHLTRKVLAAAIIILGTIVLAH